MGVLALGGSASTHPPVSGRQVEHTLGAPDDACSENLPSGPELHAQRVKTQKQPSVVPCPSRSFLEGTGLWAQELVQPGGRSWDLLSCSCFQSHTLQSSHARKTPSPRRGAEDDSKRDYSKGDQEHSTRTSYCSEHLHPIPTAILSVGQYYYYQAHNSGNRHGEVKLLTQVTHLINRIAGTFSMCSIYLLSPYYTQ